MPMPKWLGHVILGMIFLIMASLYTLFNHLGIELSDVLWREGDTNAEWFAVTMAFIQMILSFTSVSTKED